MRSWLVIPIATLLNPAVWGLVPRLLAEGDDHEESVMDPIVFLAGKDLGEAALEFPRAAARAAARAANGDILKAKGLASVDFAALTLAGAEWHFILLKNLLVVGESVILPRPELVGDDERRSNTCVTEFIVYSLLKLRAGRKTRN